MANTNNGQRKLVLVGNGMAGIGALEQILKLTRSFDISVYGEEPYPNYNRIQLSFVLEGYVNSVWLIISKTMYHDRSDKHGGNGRVGMERRSKVVLLGGIAVMMVATVVGRFAFTPVLPMRID
jgi:NAD(P)H-nitrite reductase large subunit